MQILNMKTDKCIIWPGAKRSGYGLKKVGNSTMSAHRYVWEQLNGPIPKGKQLDHKCRHRDCVNPKHLELVDPSQNKLRAWAATLPGNYKKLFGYKAEPAPVSKVFVPAPNWNIEKRFKPEEVVYSQQPDTRGIDAHYRGKNIGYMDIKDDGVVDHVKVKPRYRRKGVATGMWKEAGRTGYNPQHDWEHQSAKGKAWAEGIAKFLDY